MNLIANVSPFKVLKQNWMGKIHIWKYFTRLLTVPPQTPSPLGPPRILWMNCTIYEALVKAFGTKTPRSSDVRHIKTNINRDMDLDRHICRRQWKRERERPVRLDRMNHLPKSVLSSAMKSEAFPGSPRNSNKSKSNCKLIWTKSKNVTVISTSTWLYFDFEINYHTFKSYFY